MGSKGKDMSSSVNMIVPRSFLEQILREDIEANAVGEIEADEDGVTIRLIHMDFGGYRRVLRELRQMLDSQGVKIKPVMPPSMTLEEIADLESDAE
jgi:hypothetical protein